MKAVPLAQELKRKHDPDRLGTAPVGRLLLEFGIPATIGLLVNAAYGLIDSIFIGHGVGDLGLAAVTVAAPILLIMMAVSVFIGAGGNALMAIRLGQGRRKEAQTILGNALTLLVIAGGISLTLMMIFLEEILTLAGATAEVMPYAKQFITIIIIFGFIPQGVGMGLNNFIRTTGNPQRAMTTMIIGAVVNTIFNYLFVILLDWGVRGSAIATVIGMFISMVWVLWYFLTDASPIRLTWSSLKLSPKVVTGMLSLGVAPFAMHAASAVVNVIQNQAIVTYGAFDTAGSDGSLAALGVVIRLIQFFTMPIFGFVLAAQPIIGFNTGAKRFRRVKRAWTVSVAAATATLVVLWLTVELIPGMWIGMFGLEDPAVYDLAIFGLRSMLIMMPFIGFQMLGANYFQATGQAWKAALLSLSRQVLFYIPALLILPDLIPKLFPSVNALHGVLYAMPVADTLSVLLTAYFVMRELKHLDRWAAEEEERERVELAQATEQAQAAAV